MDKIFKFPRSDYENVKLYNQVLQKLQLYEKKKRKPKEATLKQKPSPQLEIDEVKKSKKKISACQTYFGTYKRTKKC